MNTDNTDLDQEQQKNPVKISVIRQNRWYGVDCAMVLFFRTAYFICTSISVSFFSLHS